MSIDDEGNYTDDILSALAKRGRRRQMLQEDVEVGGGGGGGRGKNGNGDKIIYSSSNIDPFYNFIPPDLFHELDRSSKELEELIDGIPSDIGTKNLKLILKLGTTFGRVLNRVGYLNMLYALQNARLSELELMSWLRYESAMREREVSKDAILQKLQEIPSRSELSSIIAQQINSTINSIEAISSSSSSSSSSRDERLIRAVGKIYDSADAIVTKVIDKAADNIAQLSTTNIDNLQENPLKTKMYDMLANITEMLMAQTKLGNLAKKKGVDAENVFNIETNKQ